MKKSADEKRSRFRTNEISPVAKSRYESSNAMPKLRHTSRGRRGGGGGEERGEELGESRSSRTSLLSRQSADQCKHVSRRQQLMPAGGENETGDAGTRRLKSGYNYMNNVMNDYKAIEDNDSNNNNNGDKKKQVKIKYVQ